MRALPFACAACLLTVASAASRPVVADAPPPECVEYREVPFPELRSFDLHLTSGCARPRSCTISWTVRCGKATHATQNAVVLEPAEERTWRASAQDCEDDWAIDTRWRCAPSR